MKSYLALVVLKFHNQSIYIYVQIFRLFSNSLLITLELHCCKSVFTVFNVVWLLICVFDFKFELCDNCLSIHQYLVTVCCMIIKLGVQCILTMSNHILSTCCSDNTNIYIKVLTNNWLLQTWSGKYIFTWKIAQQRVLFKCRLT